MREHSAAASRAIAELVSDWYDSCVDGGYRYDGRVMMPGTAVITGLSLFENRLRAVFDSHLLYRNAQSSPDAMPVCGGPAFSPLKAWRLRQDGVVALPQPGTPVVLPYSARNTYGWAMDDCAAAGASATDEHSLQPLFYLNWKDCKVGMMRIQETSPVTVDVRLADPGQTVLFPDVGVVTLIDRYGVSWERQVKQVRYELTSLGGRQQLIFATPPFEYVLRDDSSAALPTQWAISLASVDFACRNGIEVKLGALQARSRKHEFTFGATPSRRLRRVSLAWQSPVPQEWTITVYNAKTTISIRHEVLERTLTINGDIIRFPELPYIAKLELIDPSGRRLPPRVFQNDNNWQPAA
ncbi:hypothetical protein [Paludibacterium yongneupense]|uniref:hypothetical protein n=1 Tax=Paludibacterium yongneupense TaxID=400061 RepID=UPI00041EB34F|nr:hypothetical protein [Paludibacterium yongneupense]